MRVILLAFPLLIFLAACSAAEVGSGGASTPVRATAAIPTALATDDDRLAVSATSLPMAALSPTPGATPLPTIVLTSVPTSVSTVPPARTAQPPRPIPTATPALPVILSFTVDQAEVLPGESVTLNWASSGGVRAVIQQYLPNFLGPFLSVPSSGSLTVTISDNERHWHQFVLVASDDAGHFAEASLTVRIRCPYAYFFTPAPAYNEGDSCPADPATFSRAAEQVFEGGRMIWFEAQDTIYMFDDDRGRDGAPSRQFVDTWTPDEPESDPSIVPPEGFYQPIRGFGKVWRNEPRVREQLGWALAPEQGFDGAYQRGWAPYYGWMTAYLRTVDGRIIRLSRNGGWEYVTP